jgi:hypothetical protein
VVSNPNTADPRKPLARVRNAQVTRVLFQAGSHWKERKVIRRIRTRMTYANVMATIAVFIALGGAGYAATKVGSKEIRNNSVRSKDVRNDNLRGKDLRDNTLSDREIRESTLTVPRASTAGNADTLNGRSAEALRVKCPAGTVLAVGACFETEPRAAQVHNVAAGECGRAGRRLPTFGELLGYFQTQPQNLAAGGELTANVFGAGEPPGNPLYVVVMTDETGATPAYVQAGVAGNERQFRCVGSLSN